LQPGHGLPILGEVDRSSATWDAHGLTELGGTMWDRYDPRENDRDHGNAWDCSPGGRGGTSDRNWNTERDPRDVFHRDLDLPRGLERRRVRERERVYEISGAESRMLATVGAFRVVSESDLNDLRDDASSPRRSVRHLEGEGLIRTSKLSSDDRAVVLTERGRDLLEDNRYERHDRAHELRQSFWAGLRKPRELTHDTKVYRAYRRAEERLREQGGSVRRVVLDYELKRDYQPFLHERNRDKQDCDGRPDREPEEIVRWAREHDLPYDNGHVHFPDARIDYEDRDGLSRHEDLEIVTGHYRGAHAGAVARSGFSCYRAIGGIVGGCASTGTRGGSRHPKLAEELLA
jgi:DNA-binding MarR family transcriptional regulator